MTATRFLISVSHPSKCFSPHFTRGKPRTASWELSPCSTNHPQLPPTKHTHTLTQTHSNRCTFHYCRMSYLRAKRGGEKALWEQQISCLQPFKKTKTKAAHLKARAAALITAEPHFGHRLRLSTNTRTSLKSIYYGNTFCNNVNNKHPPEPINIHIKTQLILNRISFFPFPFFASRLRRRKKNICVFVGEQKMQESVRMWF